jgi:hypothetical protein
VHPRGDGTDTTPCGQSTALRWCGPRRNQQGIESERSHRILDLQRSAGNSAIVAALRSLEHAAAAGPTVSPSGRKCRSGPLTSTEANSCTIQRATTDDSDPDLKGIYDDMVSRSETFHALDARLTESHGAIRLVDSMKLPGRLRGVADYVGHDHTIRAPASGAEPQLLRHNLMWEMHNALNRAEHERTGRVFAPHLPRSLGGPAMPSLEQASMQKYHVAARALALEWDEWATLIEADLNALKVNFQLSGQGDAWRNAIDDNLNYVAGNAGDPNPALHREVWTPYISSFSGTDPRSWRYFSNYLEKQLEMKHTVGYDTNARNQGAYS